MAANVTNQTALLQEQKRLKAENEAKMKQLQELKVTIETDIKAKKDQIKLCEQELQFIKTEQKQIESQQNKRLEESRKE